MRGRDTANDSWQLMARSIRLREELHRFADGQHNNFPVYKEGLEQRFELLRAGDKVGDTRHVPS